MRHWLVFHAEFVATSISDSVYHLLIQEKCICAAKIGRYREDVLPENQERDFWENYFQGAI